MIHAAFVVAMSLQSALDTPHHYTPPAYQAEAAVGDQGDVGPGNLGQDQIQIAAEDASNAQHETETSVDHAMIGPDAVVGLPPLRARSHLDLTTAGLPGSRPATTIERPPRAILAA